VTFNVSVFYFVDNDRYHQFKLNNQQFTYDFVKLSKIICFR